MASRLPPLVFRLAILVAIAVSSALLIDYFRPLPAFCDVGSGCEKVRASGYGSVLGVPVPLLGLLAFASLMFLSLIRNDSVERIVRGLALVAGAAGISLLLVQALQVKAFCKLCVVVDSAAIVAALAAWWSPRSPQGPPAAGWLWPVATLVAILLPSGWALLQPSPPVPPEIASLWVPGKINVVEFADFQCPFCRQLHPRMVEVLREYDERVHFVRLNVPLASHASARDAARAYCCAGDQGKGDAMADALFASDQLSPEACERLAASLGVSLAEYRVCIVNPATDARIDDESRRARSAGLKGLPTVWVGDQLLVGLQPIEAVRAAFADASRGKTRLPTALLWAAVVAALAVFGTLAMRTRPAAGEGRPLT
jgi:predicted DsbA family dithiol-disulfide isomerase/uncharacterized membrane protein